MKKEVDIFNVRLYLSPEEYTGFLSTSNASPSVKDWFLKRCEPEGRNHSLKMNKFEEILLNLRIKNGI